MTANQMSCLKDTLRAAAEAHHSGLPQYTGFWDAWVLGQVTRRVSGKMGVSFEVGDIVLADYSPRSFRDRDFSAYSARTQINTLMVSGSVRWLLRPDATPYPGTPEQALSPWCNLL